MNIVLLGKPGAGKGSLCTEITKNEHAIHVSTGQIFRNEIAKGTELGKIADSYISKGNLVPDDITNKIMENLLRSNPNASYLFDGYPRTLNQAIGLTKLSKDLGINLDAVIDLDVDDDLVIKRLLSRRVCKNCGETYNLITRNPKVEGICDVCGKEITIRHDDNEIAIKERLHVYIEQTQPLIDYYKKLGLLIKVDASKDPHELYRDIKEKLSGNVSLSSKNL